jgi:hypothetical protein
VRWSRGRNHAQPAIGVVINYHDVPEHRRRRAAAPGAEDGAVGRVAGDRPRLQQPAGRPGLQRPDPAPHAEQDPLLRWRDPQGGERAGSLSAAACSRASVPSGRRRLRRPMAEMLRRCHDDVQSCCAPTAAVVRADRSQICQTMNCPLTRTPCPAEAETSSVPPWSWTGPRRCSAWLAHVPLSVTDTGVQRSRRSATCSSLLHTTKPPGQGNGLPGDHTGSSAGGRAHRGGGEPRRGTVRIYPGRGKRRRKAAAARGGRRRTGQRDRPGEDGEAMRHLAREVPERGPGAGDLLGEAGAGGPRESSIDVLTTLRARMTGRGHASAARGRRACRYMSGYTAGGSNAAITPGPSREAAQRRSAPGNAAALDGLSAVNIRRSFRRTHDIRAFGRRSEGAAFSRADPRRRATEANAGWSNGEGGAVALQERKSGWLRWRCGARLAADSGRRYHALPRLGCWPRRRRRRPRRRRLDPPPRPPPPPCRGAWHPQHHRRRQQVVPRRWSAPRRHRPTPPFNGRACTEKDNRGGRGARTCAVKDAAGGRERRGVATAGQFRIGAWGWPVLLACFAADATTRATLDHGPSARTKAEHGATSAAPQ